MAGKRSAADQAAFDQQDAELDEALAQADASGVVPSGSSDHARLRNGELAAQAFLDLQVERALAPYLSTLEPALIDAMRQVLAAQLEQDPLLAELAARATQIES